MSIEVIIREAVNLAAHAWDRNPDLRKLFGSAKPDKNYPLPITGENVGMLLRRINQKRQIIVKNLPRDAQGRGALAHAVISPNDYFGNLFKEKYAVRETILVDKIFFINKIRNSIAFQNAKSDVGKVSESKLRAVALLHEARHLYLFTGHGVDPSTYDGLWNDYILWTGFLGQKVAW